MVGNAPYNTTILTSTFHDLIPQPFPQFSHRRSFAVHQYPDFVYFSHDENYNKDCDNHGGDIEQNFPQWRLMGKSMPSGDGIEIAVERLQQLRNMIRKQTDGLREPTCLRHGIP